MTMLFTKIKKQTLTLVPPKGDHERLLGGRIFSSLTETPNGTSRQVDVMDIALRLKTLADEVATHFVGRGELSHALALALAIGEHLFAYGKPGTAKSSVLRLFTEAVGGQFWRTVMNPDLSREDLIGAFDPAAIANGRWDRILSCVATCDVAFLDEIWKASPQVINILLDVLEERLVSSGGKDHAIPLLSAVSASNEIPDVTMAAYDRFLLRVEVKYISDMDDFRTMLLSKAGRKRMPVTLHSDEIRLLAGAAEVLAQNPPPEFMDTMEKIRYHFNKQDISDRRWRKYLKAACGQCLLRGSIVPQPTDLSVGKWILWSRPDERADVEKDLVGLCDPMSGEMLNVEEIFGDLLKALADFSFVPQDKQDNARVEIGGNASQLKGRVDKLMKNSQAGDYYYRLEEIKAKCQHTIENAWRLGRGD